jgi:hypothetical protein
VETKATAMSNVEPAKVKNKEQEMNVADKITATTETKLRAMRNVKAAKVKNKGQEMNVAGKIAATTETKVKDKAGKADKADKIPVEMLITKAEIQALVECSF